MEEGKAVPAPVIYSIAVSSPITPAEPPPPLGCCPISPASRWSSSRAALRWSGIALRLLHASPAAAVAFYRPKLGAVMVSSHSQK